MKKESLKTKQWKQLKKVLQRAFESSSFYKEKFSKVGFTSTYDIKTWKDFRKLPFTTRKELAKDQIANPPLGSNLTRPLIEYTLVMRTSGTTTGEPLQLPITTEEYMRYASVVSHLEKLRGTTKKDVSAVLAGATYSYLYLTHIQQSGGRFIPIVDAGPVSLLQQLERFHVTSLITSPNIISKITKAAEDERIDLKNLSVRMLITTGEPKGNTPQFRSYIREKWGAMYFDDLGTTEHGIFAVTCQQEHKHHLLENHWKYWIFEVINPDTKKVSNKGELVITNLWRLDFPLIRYKTGDVVEMVEGKCKCGSKMPYLKNGIIGRVDKRINLSGSLFYLEEIERIISRYTNLNYELWVGKENGMESAELYLELAGKKALVNLDKIKKLAEEKMFVPISIFILPPNSLPPHEGWKRKWFFEAREKELPRFLRRKLVSNFYNNILRLKFYRSYYLKKYIVK